MALQGSRLIDGMVAYAWTGLGASFGPPLLFSLWWKRTTWAGVMAGMVGGMVATVTWQNSLALTSLLGPGSAVDFNEGLDIKAAAVLISAALVVGVSLASPSPRPEDGSATPA